MDIILFGYGPHVLLVVLNTEVLVQEIWWLCFCFLATLLSLDCQGMQVGWAFLYRLMIDYNIHIAQNAE